MHATFAMQGPYTLPIAKFVDNMWFVSLHSTKF